MRSIAPPPCRRLQQGGIQTPGRRFAHTAKANTQKQPVCGGCSSTPNIVISHLTWNLKRNSHWTGVRFEDSYPHYHQLEMRTWRQNPHSAWWTSGLTPERHSTKERLWHWKWRQSFEDSYPSFCVGNCPTHMLSRWKPVTWAFQRLKLEHLRRIELPWWGWKPHILPLNYKCIKMVAPTGFEPILLESESSILPIILRSNLFHLDLHQDLTPSKGAGLLLSHGTSLKKKMMRLGIEPRAVTILTYDSDFPHRIHSRQDWKGLQTVFYIGISAGKPTTRPHEVGLFRVWQSI